MTNKPESIFVHPDAFTHKPAMYTTSRTKLGPGPEIAAIRLTDHELLIAEQIRVIAERNAEIEAGKARIAELERALCDVRGYLKHYQGGGLSQSHFANKGVLVIEKALAQQGKEVG